MMESPLFLAAFSWEGWFNGGVVGGLIGLGIGLIYKFCFGGPGRQA